MRKPHLDALAYLDARIAEGWKLHIYPIFDPMWPVNGDGWRAEMTWTNGNVVGCSMPTYADAVELLAGVYGNG